MSTHDLKLKKENRVFKENKIRENSTNVEKLQLENLQHVQGCQLNGIEKEVNEMVKCISYTG